MVAYLQPADYAAYGVEDASDSQIAAASRVVDAYLGTTSGLIWVPDATGNPAWMAGKTSVRTFRLASPITAGNGTQITVAGTVFGPGDVGQAVVIDRSNANAAETCVISGASGNTLTLETNAFAHAANATIEYGLTIAEEAKVGCNDQIRFNARPVARVFSLYGSRRYTGRNLRDASFEELLATNYNQSALWGGFPLSQCDIDGISGTCSMFYGTIPVYGQGSRLRASYLAGWDYTNLPAAIKQAVASSVLAGLESGMAGNWKVLKAGDGTIERFSAGALDSDTMAMLAPYRNMRLT